MTKNFAQIAFNPTEIQLPEFQVPETHPYTDPANFLLAGP